MTFTRELLSEMGHEDSIVLDPEILDAAIMGVCDDTGRVVYSREKLLDQFMILGMNRDEADEWISYNVIRGLPYMGELAPIIMREII